MRVTTVVRTVAIKIGKRGFFCCCLDVYLKLYLRLKFLGFHNHFSHRLYILFMVTCLICMDFVSQYIFFDLSGLVFCIDDFVRSI
jgi:hypothetical protein